MKTELNNHYGDVPCIDLAAQAEFEKRKLLSESIIELLKGQPYSTAEGILNDCIWNIKQRAIVS